MKSHDALRFHVRLFWSDRVHFGPRRCTFLATIEKMLRKHEFLFSGKEAYEMGFAKLGIPKIEFKVTGVWTKIGHKVFPPPVVVG